MIPEASAVERHPPVVFSPTINRSTFPCYKKNLNLCTESRVNLAQAYLPLRLIRLQPFSLTFNALRRGAPLTPLPPLCSIQSVFSFFFFFLPLSPSPSAVSDPGNQLCHGAELGLAGGFRWRRQHRHHAWQLFRYSQMRVPPVSLIISLCQLSTHIS